MKSMTAIFAIVFPLMLCACAPKPPPDATPALGDSLTRAQVHGEIAAEHVELVRPHSVGADRSALDTAAGALGPTGLVKDLSDAKSSLVVVQAQLGKAIHDADDAKDALKAEQQHWLGYRLRVTLRWVIGIIIAFYVVVIGLSIWLGPASAIGGVLFHLLPGSGILSVLPFVGRYLPPVAVPPVVPKVVAP